MQHLCLHWAQTSQEELKRIRLEGKQGWPSKLDIAGNNGQARVTRAEGLSPVSRHTGG